MKAKMISALKNDGELPIEFIDKFHEIDRNAFQNGQKNMRAKMMEGAVECIVSAGKNNNRWLMTYVGDYESMLKTCKTGDKVKIIIVKEDK